MLKTLDAVRGSIARVPFAKECFVVLKEIKSRGNNVTDREARHNSATLSSEDSHKESYETISRPLIII